MANPRSQSKRERFRQAVLRQHGPTCMAPVCLMPTRAIDLRLKAPHRASYTADHVIEVAILVERGGDPFDPAGGVPAHWACNASRGAAFGNRWRGRKRPPNDPMNRSRPW